MSGPKERFLADKALRDAARGLFQTDLEYLKADLAARGVGGRIADRVSDSTLDLVDDAVDYATENKGTIAAVTAAAVLWFARRPLLDALGDLLGDEDGEDAEQSGLAGDYTHD